MHPDPQVRPEVPHQLAPPAPVPPAPAAAPLAPLAAPPRQPPQRPRRRRAGLFWFALLVSAVVFVGAGTVAVVSYFANPSPTDVVTDYFTALAADDAKGALAYGDVPAGDHRYLTAQVLKQQLAIATLGPPQMLDVDRDVRLRHGIRPLFVEVLDG